VTGTEGADSLSSDQEDALAWFLQGGNDSLTGTNGSDYVEGGTGDDTLSMRDGRDLVYGGEGNDSIDAGIGFDSVYGGEGDDSVTGNGGNDVILGDEGNDVLAGGTGADLLYGGAGDDVLYGMSAGLSTGDSAIEIDGVDGLSGGDGNDHLILGPGDIGEGGAGDDVFEIDHSRTDLTEVARVNDFSAGDTIEVSYTPEFDTQGVEIAPVISLIENSDATGTLIMFNDVEIANIITEQTLTAAQIILTATPR
jgi:Ca2+-binding RTX toxin-like protein